MRFGLGLGMRAQAQETDVDRFTGIEREADGLQIEDQLEEAGHGHQAHEVQPIAHCHCRSDQPFASTNGTGQQDSSRSNHSDQISEVLGGWLGKVADLPGVLHFIPLAFHSTCFRQSRHSRSITCLLVHDVEQRLFFQITPEVPNKQASCAGLEIKCVVGRVG